MKKAVEIVIEIFVTLLSVFAFALGGLVFFMDYGGNRCGAVCDCFCCHMFNSRGYEACGEFGLYFGAGLGLILAIVLIIWWNKRRPIKEIEDDENVLEDDTFEDIVE